MFLFKIYDEHPAPVLSIWESLLGGSLALEIDFMDFLTPSKIIILYTLYT